jgi:hypothetical protein
MRRTFILLFAVLLLGGLVAPVGAQGSAQKARYEFSPAQGGGITGWYGNHYGVFFGDAPGFKTNAGDRFVIVHIADDSGEEVSAAAWQKGGPVRAFCNHARIPIRGGKPVYVQVYLDLTPQEYGGCDLPAHPTSGTIAVRTKA